MADQKGKQQPIDLLWMYGNVHHEQWNQYLTRCLVNRDLKELEKMAYRFQSGMNELAKQKMNTPKMCDWFVRVQGSIERTMKDIMKLNNPMALDNSFNKGEYGHTIDEKRARDLAIEAHIKKERF